MNNNELEYCFQLSYTDLCKYYQNKYGLPSVNYFATEECKSKSKKIGRTSEGLFCHHNYEDRYSNLGEPHMAKKYPFECQKKENLTYCDYLEHLLIHLKINVDACPELNELSQIKRFFNSLGFFWIAGEINTLFHNNGSGQKWRNDCYNVIKDSFSVYVSILRAALCFVDDNFIGIKSQPIEIGEILTTEIINPNESFDEEQIRGKQENYLELKQKIEEISEENNIVTVKVLNLTAKNASIFRILISDYVDIYKIDNSIYIQYQLSNLKEKYDYETIMNSYKETLCLLDDGSVWNNLKTELDKEFTDSDRLLSRKLAEGKR